MDHENLELMEECLHIFCILPGVTQNR